MILCTQRHANVETFSGKCLHALNTTRHQKTSAAAKENRDDKGRQRGKFVGQILFIEAPGQKQKQRLRQTDEPALPALC